MSTLKDGITTTTPDTIMLGPGIVYANYLNGTGTALGAVLGGGTFTLNRTKRYVAPDGGKGKIKDLGFFETIEGMLEINILEATKLNLVKMIAAANAGAWSNAEEVGTGDGTTTTFSLDTTADNVIDRAYEDGVENTTVTFNGSVLEFTTAPTSDAVITADYTYTGTPVDGDFWRITGDTCIESGDYLTNVAICFEWTGDATDGAILILDNALSVGGFALAIPTGQEEIVFPVTWEAHFTAGSETTEPWSWLHPYNT